MRRSNLLKDHGRRLVLLLFTALVFEVAVGSSGRLISFGPVSIRMALLGVLLLAGGAIVWKEHSRLLKQRYLWVLMVFALVWAASGVWGLSRGNSPSFIFNDILTFSALALVPLVLALQVRHLELQIFLSTLFWGSVLLATFTIFIHLLAPSGWLPINAINQWLNDRHQGGMALQGDGFLRIYLRSQVIFMPSMAIGLMRILERRRPYAHALGTAALMMGVILSLTRALWIGSILMLLIFVVASFRSWKRLLIAGGLVVAALAMLIASSVIVYHGPALLVQAAERLNPDLVVVIPNADAPVPTPSEPLEPTSSNVAPNAEVDAGAAHIRSQSLVLARQQVIRNPVIGAGLGYNLDSIRDDGRIEYMYWDLLMKTGIVGVLSFVLLYFWPLGGYLRRWRSRPSSEVVALSAGLAGMAASSYFNPFLNSALGLTVLLLLVVATGVSAAQSSWPRPLRERSSQHRWAPSRAMDGVRRFDNDVQSDAPARRGKQRSKRKWNRTTA